MSKNLPKKSFEDQVRGAVPPPKPYDEKLIEDLMKDSGDEMDDDKEDSSAKGYDEKLIEELMQDSDDDMDDAKDDADDNHGVEKSKEDSENQDDGKSRFDRIDDAIEEYVDQNIEEFDLGDPQNVWPVPYRGSYARHLVLDEIFEAAFAEF